MIHSHTRIACRYLRSWLALDVATALPVDLIIAVYEALRAGSGGTGAEATKPMTAATTASGASSCVVGDAPREGMTHKLVVLHKNWDAPQKTKLGFARSTQSRRPRPARPHAPSRSLQSAQPGKRAATPVHASHEYRWGVASG